MRLTRNSLLAGIAAIALAGGAGLAVAKDPAFHTMAVALPDGETAQITYSGDIPPKVNFAAEPFTADFYGAEGPFAMLDRISAEMDRDITGMMSAAPLMPEPLWDPARPLTAVLHELPPGTQQYSMISTFSGDGNVCTRTMEITGSGPHPKVVSNTYGDCGSKGNAIFQSKPFVPGGDTGHVITTKARQNGPAPVSPVQEIAYRP